MNRMPRAALQGSVNGDVPRVLPAAVSPADAARRALLRRSSAAERREVMAQPIKFTITVDFSDEEANGVSGRSTVRTAALDGLIRRSSRRRPDHRKPRADPARRRAVDRRQTVEIHTLSAEVLALLSSTAWTVRGGWVTATAYAKGDIVLQGGVVYVCMVAHTSGTFATDLAAGKWGQVTANANGREHSFSPTSTISAITVQAAIEELDSESAPVQSILVRNFSTGYRP
jgi:hypothetical protein